MMRLVGSELKKIWKSKINILLLILVVSWAGYFTYDIYHSPGLEYYDMTNRGVKDEHGNEVDGLEFYRIADEMLDEYRGKVDEAKIKQYQDDYWAYMEKYPQDTFDDAIMREAYGNDYLKLVEKSDAGKLTFEDINKECDQSPMCSYYQDENGINIRIEKYYQNDPIRAFYNAIYLGYPTTNTTYAQETLDNNAMHILLHPEKRKLFDGEMSFMEKPQPMNHEAEVVAEKLNARLETLGTFGSSVANNLFFNALRISLLPGILVVAIILANTFARENQYKTDQIIVPTKTGAFKISSAKIIAGMISGMGILLFQYLVVGMLSMIYLPIHDLGLPIMSMGNSYAIASAYFFTYQEVLITIVVLSIVAVCAISVITMCLSHFLKNRFASIIIMLLFILTPGLITFQQYDPPLSYFDKILPSYLIMGGDFFFMNNIYDTPYVVIGNTAIAWSFMALLLWLGLCALMIVGILLHAKRHVVKNR